MPFPLTRSEPPRRPHSGFNALGLRARCVIVWAGATALCACGSDESPATETQPPSGGPPAIDLPYEPCATAVRVGDFSIELASEFTQVSGQVFDAVEPALVPVENQSDGACRLLTPPTLVCDPQCAFSTETCSPDGSCIPLPVAHDLGTVTVSGLVIPMELSASERTRSYSNPARPRLPHPGFEAGADLRISATGGDYTPFELRGWGVSPLVVTSDPVTVDPGQPTTFTWEVPASGAGPAHVRLNLDINVHGSGGARIECDFPDTGTGEISASLVDALIAEGLSGFPTATLTRRTASSTEIAPGCVEFAVTSSVSSEVQVAGIVSCNTDSDCGAGGRCVPILRNCE